MRAPSALLSVTALACVTSALTLPRNEPLEVDGLLPDPYWPEGESIPRALPIENIGWSISDILAVTGNVTEAPPSDDSNVFVGEGPHQLNSRQSVDNRFLQTSTDYPFGAMGRVARYLSNGAVSWCSGSMVGSRIAVTSRHCITDDVVAYRFQPAFQNGREPYGNRAVTAIIYIPGTNEDNDGCGWKHDWALLVLDRPFNTGYLGFRPFPDASNNVQRPWWNYGYPQDKSGSGQLPYASNGFRIFKNAGCGGDPEGKYLSGNYGAFGGQSGGPVWINEDGGAWQYGLHAGRGGGYTLIAHGWALINAIVRARQDFP